MLLLPGQVPDDGGADSSQPSIRGSRTSTMPRPSHLQILTASDIADPHADDARDIHERSQDLMHRVMKHRGLTPSARAPFKDRNLEDKDKARHEFAERSLKRVRAKGIHGIRQFRISLHNMDLNRDGLIMGRSFEGALAHMGIRLRNGEYEQLSDLFGVGQDGDYMVDYACFLACGCSNWSERREEVVQEAYDFLAELCAGGKLSREILEKQFRPAVLTSDNVPGMLEHHSTQEFLNQWHKGELSADGLVTWLDFVDYYIDVSVCIPRDDEFCKFVCKSWGIDMDDWIAKKVFKNYVTCDVEYTLSIDDFNRMLDELDPTVTQEEAAAWFRALDEDDSGDVSLEEFLNSKVLKVKRLFDFYDDENSRTASKDMMIKILKNLNDAITPDEADSLYQYADLDGSGEVSFCEFLENNLLKMLNIFDEFDTDRRRCFNEAQMKLLIHKLDKYLDDHEVMQIYKAIDIDGSGDISFIEFVESHVLRAKSLFDRYDIDRSRSLTQFKFRELMLDMDPNLSSEEMEAIHDLVCDHGTGKVHLGGFLNPNLVKLKLLFDKYDQDRGRSLDSGEFKLMLRELFKSATDKDIDDLHRTIIPHGLDCGVTFAEYIQRFKEISRKHDLIQLAKRRQAREKAKKKGLKFREEW